MTVITLSHAQQFNPNQPGAGICCTTYGIKSTHTHSFSYLIDLNMFSLDAYSNPNPKRQKWMPNLTLRLWLGLG